MEGDVASRFWEKVERRGPDACWPWVAKAKTNFGYGVFGVSPGKIDGAHRVAYALTNGPIPKDGVVRHTCDNPSCCNPAHLLVGSKRDNTRDMMERGRARYISHPGEKNGRAKLTVADVATIRACNLSVRAICEKYGISKGHVWRVRSGDQWKAA